jgi:hypothetical protein
MLFSSQINIDLPSNKLQITIMSNITRRPTAAAAPAAKPVNEAALAKFIAGAPDAAPAVTAAPPAAPAHPRKMAGKQAQITFALPPELLDKVDNMANSLSISRAAFIKQALTRAVMAGGN